MANIMPILGTILCVRKVTEETAAGPFPTKWPTLGHADHEHVTFNNVTDNFGSYHIVSVQPVGQGAELMRALNLKDYNFAEHLAINPTYGTYHGIVAMQVQFNKHFSEGRVITVNKPEEGFALDATGEFNHFRVNGQCCNDHMANRITIYTGPDNNGVLDPNDFATVRYAMPGYCRDWPHFSNAIRDLRHVFPDGTDVHISVPMCLVDADTAEESCGLLDGQLCEIVEHDDITLTYSINDETLLTISAAAHELGSKIHETIEQLTNRNTDDAFGT